MSEILYSRNRARIAVEMQSGNNVISKLVRAKADTKTNTMRTAVLSGLGLNVTVAVGQQKPIVMNIKQRIIGTKGKRKGELMSRLEIGDFGTLAICAIRYCHGRQTYMPDLVRGIVRQHLTELSDKDLKVMIEDCYFQERFHLYGDERIDKPGWLRWKTELVAEKKRRTDETR